MLENAIPHVLIILDCCYAATAARDTAEGTTKELLAACSRENLTLGVGQRSFTSALIEELQSFGNSSFTVAMLHSRLITMRWRLAFTPIYALLSERGGNSIELAPLPAVSTPAPQNSISSNGSASTLDHMDTSVLEGSFVIADTSPSSQSSLGPLSQARVLLAVSVVREADCDLEQWVAWLTSQAPWDVTQVEVQVEGIYKSHSTLVLVSVPIFAWDRLPDRTAYRFIGFIKSGNLLPRRYSRSASSASIPSEVPETRHLMQSRHSSNMSPKSITARISPNMSPAAVLSSFLWNTQEDSILLNIQGEVEEKSSTRDSITENHFPKRTPEAVRERYERLREKRQVNSDVDVSQATAKSPPSLATHSPRQVPLVKTTAKRVIPSTEELPVSPTSYLDTRESKPWGPEKDQKLLARRQQNTAKVRRKRHEKLLANTTAADALAQSYMELREEIWKILAINLNEKWEIVEEKVFDVLGSSK